MADGFGRSAADAMPEGGSLPDTAIPHTSVPARSSSAAGTGKDMMDARDKEQHPASLRLHLAPGPRRMILCAVRHFDRPRHALTRVASRPANFCATHHLDALSKRDPKRHLLHVQSRHSHPSPGSSMRMIADDSRASPLGYVRVCRLRIESNFSVPRSPSTFPWTSLGHPPPEIV